jgi:hypothetical protein
MSCNSDTPPARETSRPPALEPGVDAMVANAAALPGAPAFIRRLHEPSPLSERGSGFMTR